MIRALSDQDVEAIAELVVAKIAARLGAVPVPPSPPPQLIAAPQVTKLAYTRKEVAEVLRMSTVSVFRLGTPPVKVSLVQLGYELRTFVEATRGNKPQSDYEKGLEYYLGYVLTNEREPTATEVFEHLGRRHPEEQAGQPIDVDFGKTYRRWRQKWRVAYTGAILDGLVDT